MTSPTPRMSKCPQRLLIVARVAHYRHDGRIWAYAPYAREIDVWGDLFSRVTIAGSLVDAPPPGDCAAFERSNVAVKNIASASGRGAFGKFKRMVAVPRMVAQLLPELGAADAIHVRCPCDLGLLGAVLAPAFSRNLVAKYAGQWPDYSGEPWSVRLQKRILSSRWWRGPVTVYGDWPGRPAHVVPFFTSVLTAEHIERARGAGRRRVAVPGSLRVLFVGRLSKEKNVHVLLDALSRIPSPERVECVVVGEGPERKSLEAHARRLGIDGRISFTGGLAFEQVLDQYERADVLVLASQTEGWPKAITEGMAFGLLCIGSDRGLVPQILGDGRGLVVPPGDVDALARALRIALEVPDDRMTMAGRAAAWAQRYSIEGLRAALADLLAHHWDVGQPWTTPAPVARVTVRD
jgi:glycosyltransferase involved in cell wall biosynthesis